MPTAPKKEDRYQVVLALTNGTTMPLGPTADAGFCRQVAEGINRRLAKGQKSPLNVTAAEVQRVVLL